MEAFGLSNTGPVRQINEDCFLSAQDLCLFVVADGMGGHRAGALAARTASQSIESFIRRSQETDDFSWPYGVEPSLSYDANRLKTAVSVANRRVNRLAEDHDDYLGIGTTVVSALVSDGHLVAAHVGDSRLYLWDGTTLTQLTEDDSWSATVLAKGEPRGATRHVLTNVLGARPDTDIHVLERPLAGDETLLLCSDGLHGSVPVETLQNILATERPLPELLPMFLQAALDCGNRDNVTALVVRCATP